MNEKNISYSLSIDSTVFSFPCRLAVAHIDGRTTFAGVIQWREQNVSCATDESDGYNGGQHQENTFIQLERSTREILQKIADFFGADQFIFYMETGKQSHLPETLKFILPAIRTNYIESDNLYIMVSFGKTMQFTLKGYFVFPYLKGMKFMVDCGVNAQSFRLEAMAQPEKPIDLFGPFSIGDTCLMIQAGKNIEFGLYSSLFIREIQLFGAIILETMGMGVKPTLLSAAVSDLSVPILMDNLIGKHLEGIEVLDFIKLLGLPFQDMDKFSMETVKKKEVPAIVQQFNDKLDNEIFRLEESQVQVTPFGTGANLVDLKRMRHYYINSTGKLQLMAQFYYATENTTFGCFTVERGFFVCSVIEIFGKQFEVLFSLKESEGMLAYAKVPAIDLGFLRIDSSKLQNDNSEMIPISQNSVMSQLIDLNKEGIVFFLMAGKSGVSFYFDGSIEILKIFRMAARILYVNRQISIDFRTDICGLFTVSLHLLVDYDNFRSGKFEFSFMLDTSGLTEKLTAVTKKIDEAVDRIKDKINNAKKEIDRAQKQVNQLYSQISYLDGKIDECRQAICKAKWWKKAFVAIAKGAQIGAYEVAKVGVYAAIGVATAALQVAKGIVNLSGKVGEAVLKAVKAVIKGAMSVFYINYIKLDAKANLQEQYFNAEIDFILFGKKYNLSKKIGKAAMGNNPTDALSGAINDHISDDLNHIEDGAFRSSWRQYEYGQYTVKENITHLDEAKKYLESSVNLIKSMQNTYENQLGMPLEECGEMNVSLIDALSQAENILETGKQAGNVAALGNAMGGLKRSVATQEKKGVYRDGELAETKRLIEEYDEARKLYDKVSDSVNVVQRYKREIEKHNESIHNKTGNRPVIMEDTDEKMGKVILELEEQMYEQFPVNRSGKTFINLSREDSIRRYFAETEERLGVQPDERIEMLRSRSRKGEYQNRL